MMARALVAIFVAGALASPALAQNAPLFGAGGPATTIKLNQLGAGWQSVNIHGPEELKNTGSLSSLAGGIMGAMFGGAMPTSSYTPPQYTQGATTTLGTETFLIVYRPDLKGLDFGALMKLGEAGGGNKAGELPMLQKLTPETPLQLTLINVRNISSVTGIRPFNLQQELAESAKAAEQEAKLMKEFGNERPGADALGGADFEFPEPDEKPKTSPAKKPVPARKPVPLKKPAPKK